MIFFLLLGGVDESVTSKTHAGSKWIVERDRTGERVPATWTTSESDGGSCSR